MEYQLTLNWPDFLERHWQKRPVVLKRGFNNFIDPISPDELAGLAMESEVELPWPTFPYTIATNYGQKQARPA